jgi:hypothetical protein
MYLPKAVTGAASSPTLPVVTENAACTATTTNNTGVNSSYTKLLTCNGGNWKPVAAGAVQTATIGTACTASDTNNVAISPDYKAVLSCQSGAWSAPSGSTTSACGVIGTMTCSSGFVYICRADGSWSGGIASMTC